MNKVVAEQNFKAWYADELKALKHDYCAKQFLWSTYLDDLCKCGEITQKQYDTWQCPFKSKI